MKAFPSEGKLDLIFDGKSWVKDPNSGMDLRDYFAAKAMQGCVSLFNPNDFFNPERLTKVSYQIADAMMEARNATK